MFFEYYSWQALSHSELKENQRWTSCFLEVESSDLLNKAKIVIMRSG